MLGFRVDPKEMLQTVFKEVRGGEEGGGSVHCVSHLPGGVGGRGGPMCKPSSRMCVGGGERRGGPAGMQFIGEEVPGEGVWLSCAHSARRCEEGARGGREGSRVWRLLEAICKGMRKGKGRRWKRRIAGQACAPDPPHTQPPPPPTPPLPSAPPTCRSRPSSVSSARSPTSASTFRWRAKRCAAAARSAPHARFSCLPR